MLSGVNGASLGLLMLLRVLVIWLRLRLGGIRLGWLLNGVPLTWSPPDDFVMPDAPTVWTDGSLVLDQVTGVSSSGAGFFAHQADKCWRERRWGYVDHVRPEGAVPSCGGFLFCSSASPVCSES